MKPFAYRLARTADEALAWGGASGASFIAGGTTQLDLMKLEVFQPSQLVDLNGLNGSGFLGVEAGPQGLRIGALERMSDVAASDDVRLGYRMISEALLASASPQLRNMATIGGNLLQRTRCPYYRDTASACNRRVPGSGCGALAGENRGHAIFGTSERCVATHPSDLAVALIALDAEVRIQGLPGVGGGPAVRTMKLDELYLLPGSTPEREHALRSGELIVAVEVPPLSWARRSRYVKVRDRASFEFALVSAAVALDLEGGVVRDARVAAGGVGTKPWRLPAVEGALRGKAATREVFEAATSRAAEGARPLEQNGFKVELLRRTLVKALLETARLGEGGAA